MKLTRLLLLVAAGWSMSCPRVAGAALNVGVPGVGVVILFEPDGMQRHWVYESRKGEPTRLLYVLDQPGSHRLVEPAATWLELTLSADDPKAPHDTQEKLDALAKEADATYARGSREGAAAKPARMAASRGAGSYVVYTYVNGIGKALGSVTPCLVSGVFVVDGMLARFTMGTDGPQGADCQKVLKFIEEGMWVQELSVEARPEARMHLPAMWSGGVMHSMGGPGPLRVWVNSSDNALGIEISGTPVAALEGDAARKEAAAMAAQIGGVYLKGSLEQKTTLVELKSASGVGYYAVYTQKPDRRTSHDRNVAPGLFLMKGLVVNFTITTDDAGGPEFKQALGVIEGMYLAGDGAPGAK